MKIATISATEAKNRFGDVIRRAYRGQEHIIVERGGIPVVAILPISDYEQFLTKEQPDAIETVGADISICQCSKSGWKSSDGVPRRNAHADA